MLCDASSVLVLVSVCLSPLTFSHHRWLAAMRKGRELLCLPLPVHSLSTTSPMRCLHVEADGYWVPFGPRLSSQGRTGRWVSKALVNILSRKENWSQPRFSRRINWYKCWFLKEVNLCSFYVFVIFFVKFHIFIFVKIQGNLAKSILG